MKKLFHGTFRSLNSFNYRLWISGIFVSNIGTWMQRIAQDWLVLVHLTHHNATAVGIITALQFAPVFLLLPFSGYAADHFDRRKFLIFTQMAMGLTALGLGILTLSGLVRLWHVYLFGLILGAITAIDAPARQTFVSELVKEEDIPNAVALNSTSFNSARLIGPAISGFLIAAFGSGGVFLLNAASFGAVILALSFLRLDELYKRDKSTDQKHGLSDGFRYVRHRPDIKTILAMLFLICTFGLNFPIFISTMAVTVFHGEARLYGLLMSSMAIGSVTGTLFVAGQANPHIRLLFLSTVLFGISCLLGALMPDALTFGLVLVLIGLSAQIFTTASNSLVQLSTDSKVRGRVVAILLAVSVGGTPLGSLLIGRVADIWGARYALGIGAISGFTAALIGLCYLVKYHRLHLYFKKGDIAFRMKAVGRKIKHPFHRR
ncbi:MFS transporter [Zymomonas sp.]|uniref:MFS transporter n=1 Tax=Zymomonas sp. TaxID=2068624 RepID=UPI0025F1134E|nr:MFS transporter [Zymomonas sp.]MCA1956517.1 MFS transporter [Zymomonas sp.]